MVGPKVQLPCVGAARDQILVRCTHTLVRPHMEYCIQFWVLTTREMELLKDCEDDYGVGAFLFWRKG